MKYNRGTASSLSYTARDKASSTQKGITKFLDKHPILSVGVVLIFIFALILLGDRLRQPEEIPQKDESVKKVEAFYIGQAPKVDVTGTVKKSGIIRLIAQTPGVVYQVFAKNGAELATGARILRISTNYSGSSVNTLQRQLAQKQYDSYKDTLDTQLEIIDESRNIINKGDALGDTIKEINEKSVKETSDLIDLNEEIVDTLEETLTQLEKTNVDGANDQLILETQALLLQFKASLNSAKNGVAFLVVESADDSPSTSIVKSQKEIGLKQLEFEGFSDGPGN